MSRYAYLALTLLGLTLLALAWWGWQRSGLGLLLPGLGVCA